MVERGLSPSREQARRAILGGRVRVNGQLARKASDAVRPGDQLELAAPERFVSRGGAKLEHALECFGLEVRGLTALDLGASTGGFTDCLLQRGAARVYAVDVGRGQLAWTLRRDPRVVVMERINARELTASHFPPPFDAVDLVVIDCSFISLRKIIAPAVALLRPSGRIVALVKPQFEAGKAEADRGAGVIRDPAIHQRVLRELAEFVAGLPSLHWRSVTESPVLGWRAIKSSWCCLKKLPDTIKNVGLLGNSDKAEAFDAVGEAARLVLAAGRKLYSDPATAELAKIKAALATDAATLARQVDLLLVFGGDGTILRVAREIAGSRTPLLGINIGSLGFLTAVPSDQLPRALEHVWKGEFRFENRVLLQAAARCGGRTIEQTALNDLVISRGIFSRLIELDVRVDGDLLTRYRCDGLIVSSPTGSTAYFLAAGGAVVFPTAAVLALTPICPHTLSNRALIVPLSATIEVTVVSPRLATILSADGQVMSELAVGDRITVRRSRRTVRLMQLAGSSFCETLRRKLHWRGATM